MAATAAQPTVRASGSAKGCQGMEAALQRHRGAIAPEARFGHHAEAVEVRVWGSRAFRRIQFALRALQCHLLAQQVQQCMTKCMPNYVLSFEVEPFADQQGFLSSVSGFTHIMSCRRLRIRHSYSLWSHALRVKMSVPFCRLAANIWTPCFLQEVIVHRCLDPLSNFNGWCPLSFWS